MDKLPLSGQRVERVGADGAFTSFTYHLLFIDQKFKLPSANTTRVKDKVGVDVAVDLLKDGASDRLAQGGFLFTHIFHTSAEGEFKADADVVS